MKKIISDPDVKRSLAYLTISVGVAGAKVLIDYLRQRRNGSGGR